MSICGNPDRTNDHVRQSTSSSRLSRDSYLYMPDDALGIRDLTVHAADSSRHVQTATLKLITRATAHDRWDSFSANTLRLQPHNKYDVTVSRSSVCGDRHEENVGSVIVRDHG